MEFEHSGETGNLKILNQITGTGNWNSSKFELRGQVRSRTTASMAWKLWAGRTLSAFLRKTILLLLASTSWVTADMVYASRACRGGSKWTKQSLKLLSWLHFWSRIRWFHSTNAAFVFERRRICSGRPRQYRPHKFPAFQKYARFWKSYNYGLCYQQESRWRREDQPHPSVGDSALRVFA